MTFPYDPAFVVQGVDTINTTTHTLTLDGGNIPVGSKIVIGSVIGHGAVSVTGITNVSVSTGAVNFGSPVTVSKATNGAIHTVAIAIGTVTSAISDESTITITWSNFSTRKATVVAVWPPGLLGDVVAASGNDTSGSGAVATATNDSSTSPYDDCITFGAFAGNVMAAADTNSYLIGNPITTEASSNRGIALTYRVETSSGVKSAATCFAGSQSWAAVSASVEIVNPIEPEPEPSGSGGIKVAYGGVARAIKSIKVAHGGVARRVKSVKVAMDGVARLAWPRGDAPTPGWDPREISGLLVWYSSEYERVVNKVGDRSRLAQLTDLSGNNNHAVDGVFGNGYNVLHHTGGPFGDGYIDTRYGAVASCFLLPNGIMSDATAGEAFIITRNVGGSARGLWKFGTVTDSGSSVNHFTWSDNVIYDDFGTNTRRTVYDLDTIQANDSWLRYHTRSAAGSWAAWIENIRVANFGTNTVRWNAQPILGGGEHPVLGVYRLHGFTVFLLFGRTLTDTERTDLFNWSTSNPNGGLI